MITHSFLLLRDFVCEISDFQKKKSPKWDDISPVREIQKLEVPVYLIGGSADVVAPASGIQRLYTAASCEKNLWLVKGVGHGDFFFCAPLEYQKRIGEFLRKYLPE